MKTIINALHTLFENEIAIDPNHNDYSINDNNDILFLMLAKQFYNQHKK